MSQLALEPNLQYVIYSANESAVAQGASDKGYWSAGGGWGEEAAATLYTKADAVRTALPPSLGDDAQFLPFVRPQD